MTVVVGTTLTTFAMSEPDAWSAWLHNCLEQKASHGDDVRHFAAIETDARGIEPFETLIAMLTQLGGEYFTYSLDDGRTRVDMSNRLRHITFGQNLVTDYCCADPAVTHLLFLAADCAAPPDIIPRMLEMEHPIVAPYISTYGLRGDPVLARPATGERFPAEWGVENAMASAAAIFIARDVFRQLRWRWDLDAGMSDDPCFHHDAKTLLSIPTLVRHDVRARHYPEAIGAYDTRFDPAALEVPR